MPATPRARTGRRAPLLWPAAVAAVIGLSGCSGPAPAVDPTATTTATAAVSPSVPGASAPASAPPSAPASAAPSADEPGAEPACPAQALAVFVERLDSAGWSAAEAGRAAVVAAGVPEAVLADLPVLCVVRGEDAAGRAVVTGLVDTAGGSSSAAAASLGELGWTSSSVSPGAAFSAGDRYTSPDAAGAVLVLLSPTLDVVDLYGLDGPPYPVVFAAGPPELTAVLER